MATFLGIENGYKYLVEYNNSNLPVDLIIGANLSPNNDKQNRHLCPQTQESH